MSYFFFALFNIMEKLFTHIYKYKCLPFSLFFPML